MHLSTENGSFVARLYAPRTSSAQFDTVGAPSARIHERVGAGRGCCTDLVLYVHDRKLPSAVPPDRIGRLRELIDAYNAGLRDYLSAHERAVLPFALVRNVLPPFCNLWHVRDQAVYRRYIRQITSEVERLLELLAEVKRWQCGFA